MNKILSFLCALVLLGTSIGLKADPLNINILNSRHAFYRNEEAEFLIRITNTGNSNAEKVSVIVELSPLKQLNYQFDIKPGENIPVIYKVTCSDLKPGSYNLRVVTIVGEKSDEKEFPIYVSQQPNPQRLPVMYWHAVNTAMVRWGIDHGFNTFSGLATFSDGFPGDLDSLANMSRMEDLFEFAVKERINIGLKVATTNSPKFEGMDEVHVLSKVRNDSVTQDGARLNRICLKEPFVIENSEKLIRSYMEAFCKYPSFWQMHINSEYASPICYSEDCIQRLKVETGLDLLNYRVDPLNPPMTASEAVRAGLPVKLVSAVPVGGIIEDDNPYYKFYLWWWKRGMGDSPFNESVSSVVKEYRDDIITWHDPFRLAPVYGTHRGLDGIGHWNYPFPDPKYAAYTESMITAARPENQKIVGIITTLLKAGWIAPSDSSWIFLPHDLMREVSWITISGRPDVLSNYMYSKLSPQVENDNFHRDPKSFDVMKEMSDNVYKPLGPVIRQMERTPRKAAILCSGSSFLFNEIQRGGWPNTAIYPFYSVLLMAHVPTDVIFDETIDKYGLDQYEILFLHQCETLTRGVYNKILEWQKNGGIVVGDELLRADIPVNYTFRFDFEHRNRLLANLAGKENTSTADEDNRLMTSYVDKLRNTLDPHIKRYVDSDSPEVLFNVFENGPVKYVFIVNDKRKYGKTYGQKWKAVHEEGVEQTITVKLKNEFPDKSAVIYDLRENRPVPAEKSGDHLIFSRTLGPGDGTIIAVYPDPVSRIVISCPKMISRGGNGAINISLLDSKGLNYGSQPLLVTIKDPSGTETDYSDYYVTSRGSFDLKIDPAVNDLKGKWTIKVKDLTSGIEASSGFNVR